jgi:hypothetical protein
MQQTQPTLWPHRNDPHKLLAAESVADALMGARDWIKDNMHHARHVRIVDLDGTVMFEKLRSEFQ